MAWLRAENRVPVGHRSGLERDWVWSWELPMPERDRWQRWMLVAGTISDIALAIGLTLGTTFLVLLAPFAGPARIGLSLPFVLFLPGYVLVAALYPRKGDLDLVERLALSLGLSIAVVPLIGLGLNYSPWGIRLNPTLAFITLFIVFVASVAVYRRLALPSDEAVMFPIPKWPQLRIAEGFLGLLLLVAVAGLGTGAYFLAASSNGSEGVTEFYVLGPDGRAEGYPTAIDVGEEFTLILGVVNREGEDASYRIQATIAGRPAASPASRNLANNEKWESPIALTAEQPGSNLKVEFVLYKGDNGVPYRTLYLWLDVEGHPPAT